MAKDDLSSTVPSGTLAVPPVDEVTTNWRRVVRRRSFLKGLGVAGAAVPAGALLTTNALASEGGISEGDAALLRFLAAAEIIESDLWQQYNELGGANGGNPAYILALQNLDGDMPQYITDNTDDELSHAAFLNAYLVSKGAEPVNLDKFRTLPSSKATGAQQIGRLTNLMNLDVDTSWYTRYRSSENPDFGDSFTSPLVIKHQPAIPISDADTDPGQSQPVPPTTPQQSRMQAIANTAGFHFPFIEVGGSSLYTTLALQASSLEVLRIIISIGGVEVDHFSLWHDKAGNAVSQPLAGVTDPETGLTFPDFNNPPGRELFQTNKILPEPCDFINEGLPDCSVIRPSSTRLSGAMAAVRAFTGDGLFRGQKDPRFFQTLNALAAAADAARRHVD